MNKEESDRWGVPLSAGGDIHRLNARAGQLQRRERQSPVPDATAMGSMVFQRDTAQTDTDDTRRSMRVEVIDDPYDDDSNEAEPTTEELIQGLTEAVSQLAANVRVLSSHVDNTYSLTESIIRALNDGYYPSPYEEGVMLKTVERSPDGLYTHEQVVEAIDDAVEQIKMKINRRP